jgi:Undecaprenyl-phosphate galactose phosphotransferase WbaP
MNRTLQTSATFLSELSENHNFGGSIIRRLGRFWMAFWLGLSDSICLASSFALAIVLRAAIGGGFEPLEFYLRMIPILFVFVGVLVWRGLYPSVGLNPVEELQRLIISISAVYLLVTGFTFWMHSAVIFSRLVFAFSWILTLILVPFGRWFTRSLLAHFGYWGEPVAIIGYGVQAKGITHYLSNNPQFGLRPAIVIEELEEAERGQPSSLPRFSLNSQEPFGYYLQNIRTAVLIMSEVTANLKEVVVDQQRFNFRRLIVIPDIKWLGSLGITPYDMQGFIGLELKQNLLNPWHQLAKRGIDLVLVMIFGILLFPLVIAICILIKIDSRGGILYSQIRIGRDGKTFRILKFRTMIENAEETLDKYLELHQELRTEWETTQKLRRDPRITRIGKLLRKLSLDELPQLINVLKGDMSLVGPRPFFPDQKILYGRTYEMYRRVRPGMTGLWQVSGRNQTTFLQRAELDEYYVRQWSVWLDFYILIKTIGTVLYQDGAY